METVYGISLTAAAPENIAGFYFSHPYNARLAVQWISTRHWFIVS